MFLEFSFKALKQRQRVRRGTGKACDDFVIVQATCFPGGMLKDVITQGYLAVCDQDHFTVFADAENGCAMQLRASG
jgi:hypothetical protein